MLPHSAFLELKRRPKWEVVADLRRRLLELFDADPEVRAALLDLAERHEHVEIPNVVADIPADLDEIQETAPDSSALAAYHADVIALARRLGLSQIKPVANSITGGEEVLHRWFWWGRRWRLWLSHSALYGGDSPPPELLQVQVTTLWNPLDEPVADARKRLRRRVDSVIDRHLQNLSGRWQAYTTSPRRRNSQRDLTLLYWRVRHGDSWASIADRWQREHPDPSGLAMGEGEAARAATRIADYISVRI